MLLCRATLQKQHGISEKRGNKGLTQPEMKASAFIKSQCLLTHRPKMKHMLKLSPAPSPKICLSHSPGGFFSAVTAAYFFLAHAEIFNAGRTNGMIYFISK